MLRPIPHERASEFATATRDGRCLLSIGALIAPHVTGDTIAAFAIPLDD